MSLENKILEVFQSHLDEHLTKPCVEKLAHLVIDRVQAP